MATKLEVQIRYCFCCGITIGALLIALYTIVLFAGLIALSLWGMLRPSQITTQYYENCTMEAKAYRHQCEVQEQNQAGVLESKFVICDASSYHCSLGLYTEELKFPGGQRALARLVDVVIWALLIVAAVLVLVGLCIRWEWLLVPWLLMMVVEVVRGLVSVFFIFFFCYGNLTRIAVGIFFLGVQILHISLVIIMIGKFQELRLRNKPVKVQPGTQNIMADGSHVYPTMPAQGYSTGTAGREGYYQPQNGYNTYAGKEGTIYRTQQSAPSTANPYGTYGGRSTMG